MVFLQKWVVGILRNDRNQIKKLEFQINNRFLKGTVREISGYSQCKKGNALYARILLIVLNLIKNMEETVAFRTQKVFISVSFSNKNHASRLSSFAEKPQIKIKSLDKQKRQSFHGYRCKSDIVIFT